MQAGDFVSVWVYAHEDTSYSVSGQSGFSCVRVETTEGFGADLASDQQVGVTGWTEVAEWEVSGTDGRAGLFSLGSGFDMSTGRYTASVEGVYFASAQVRLDGADTGRFEVLLGLDGDPELSRFLQVVDGGPSPDIAGFSVSGVLKLEAGDFVSVWVYSHADSSYTVSSQSGFSAVLLDSTAGFAAAMRRQLHVPDNG